MSYLLEYGLQQIAGLLNHEFSIVFFLKKIFEKILCSTNIQMMLSGFDKLWSSWQEFEYVE